jgi:hypothetical protein
MKHTLLMTRVRDNSSHSYKAVYTGYLDAKLDMSWSPGFAPALSALDTAYLDDIAE